MRTRAARLLLLSTCCIGACAGGPQSDDADAGRGGDTGNGETGDVGDVLTPPPSATLREYRVLVLDVSRATPARGYELQVAAEAAGFDAVMVLGDGSYDDPGWAHCMEAECVEACAANNDPMEYQKVDVAQSGHVGEFSVAATLLPSLCGSATVDSVVSDWHGSHSDVWADFYAIAGPTELRAPFIDAFDDDTLGPVLCEDCGGQDVSVYRVPIDNSCVRFGTRTAVPWAEVEGEAGVTAVEIRVYARPVCGYPAD